ncbi:hypothetical protein [Streptomyces sp. NPDC057838]|uniref:hypothetical protein n=1 Tax=unclassified Streptomyces TaxID=2593676 RepID=UPI003690FCCF
MAKTIIAPYARAAVLVDVAGNIVRARNITAVQRVATGHYRVTVAEQIDTTSAVCQATVAAGAPSWTAVVHVGTHPTDNNHIVDVWTGAGGAAADQPFHLAVL